MILLFFSFQGYVIPGITIYGERLMWGSYNTVYIDSGLIDLSGSFISALEYAGGVDVETYGSPYSLTQIKSMGGRHNETAVFINGIPVNDIKTGGFDFSLVQGGVRGIELLKGGLNLPGVTSTMGAGVNIKKSPENSLSLTAGSFGFIEGSVGKGDEKSGFNINLSMYNGFRSNQDGRSGGIDLFYNGLFLTALWKKTGLPGPKPGNAIPPYGDSTAWTLYDRQEDRFVAISYTLNGKDYNVSFYGVYSRLIPYSRYYYGKMVEEKDDYRTYTGGIKANYLFRPFSFGFNLRVDSAAYFRPDTMWGKLLYNLSMSSSAEEELSHLFYGGGFVLDFDARENPLYNFYAIFGFRKGIEGYLKFSRDYRKPTLNELYWPYYSNPDLSPEISRNTEISISDRNFSITGFYRDVSDMIGYDASYKPINVNRAFIKGIEGSASLDFKTLKMIGTFNFTDGIEKVLAIDHYDSTWTPVMDTFYYSLEYTPKYRASLFAYTHSDPVIFIGLRYRDHIERYSFGITYTLNSYVLIDLGMKKKIGNVSIDAMIKNLLNNETQQWFGYSQDSYYPGEPRSIRLGISGRL